MTRVFEPFPYLAGHLLILANLFCQFLIFDTWAQFIEPHFWQLRDYFLNILSVGVFDISISQYISNFEKADISAILKSFENIDINIDIAKKMLKNIDIDIAKVISGNIDIDIAIS